MSLGQNAKCALYIKGSTAQRRSTWETVETDCQRALNFNAELRGGGRTKTRTIACGG